jgi:3-methylcrotonyl-CoA carboxylase alpha subunit
MEMNTRLQVEHPVTEEITGVDLVEWQLRVASGEPLPKRQEELSIEGHAIEARLYAEDPAANFLPSTGALDYFDLGETGRIETGVEEGDAISPFYDPMIAKLVAWAETRSEAIDRLAAMAGNVEVWPVRTNAAFLANALGDQDFVAGSFDTGFIARKLDTLVPHSEPDERAWQSAADFLVLAERDGENGPSGFRLNAPPALYAVLSRGGETRRVSAGAIEGIDGASAVIDDAHVILFSKGQAFKFARGVRGTPGAAAGDGAILAPMPGKVIAVDVAEGDEVAEGQRLLVIEAMKMEHALVAPFAGLLSQLTVHQGDQVEVEVLLARVERPAD